MLSDMQSTVVCDAVVQFPSDTLQLCLLCKKNHTHIYIYIYTLNLGTHKPGNAYKLNEGQ